MEKTVFISEEEYQKAKRNINKDNEYFTQKELENLMQFLM